MHMQLLGAIIPGPTKGGYNRALVPAEQLVKTIWGSYKCYFAKTLICVQGLWIKTTSILHLKE